MFVFDPNNPHALAAKWRDEVGILHPDARINAWAFFGINGEFLDWWVPDIDGKWVDVTSQGTSAAWPVMKQRSDDLHATDVLMIHTHPSDLMMSGPCDEAAEILTSALIEMTITGGPKVRGCIILRGTELEGALWTGDTPDKIAGCTSSDEIDAVLENTMPDDELAELLRKGDELIEEARQRAANGDDNAAALLPILETVQAALRAGKQPDPALVQEGVRLTDERERPDSMDIFDLPPLDVPKIKFLN